MHEQHARTTPVSAVTLAILSPLSPAAPRAPYVSPFLRPRPHLILSSPPPAPPPPLPLRLERCLASKIHEPLSAIQQVSDYSPTSQGRKASM
jgi:hypothetical protein